MREAYGFALLSLVPFCLSVWFAFLYFTELEYSSAKWSQIQGRVIQSYGYYVKSRSGRTLRARIFYEYSKDSKTYQSNVIGFGTHRHVGEFARAYLERYPLSKRVTVYYDPRNPQNSCLEPSNFNSMFNIIIYFAIGLFVLGCVLLNKGLNIFHRLETNPHWTG